MAPSGPAPAPLDVVAHPHSSPPGVPPRPWRGFPRPALAPSRPRRGRPWRGPAPVPLSAPAPSPSRSSWRASRPRRFGAPATPSLFRRVRGALARPAWPLLPGPDAAPPQRGSPRPTSPLPWRGGDAPARLARPCLWSSAACPPRPARPPLPPVQPPLPSPVPRPRRGLAATWPGSLRPRPWRARGSAPSLRAVPPCAAWCPCAARPRPGVASAHAAAVPLRGAAPCPRLGPGVCATRSWCVSAALRVRAFAWCAQCFGVARRVLGATRSVLLRVTCPSTPRRVRLPLATCLPPVYFMHVDHIIYINEMETQLRN
jgi:hypothetical protein